MNWNPFDLFKKTYEPFGGNDTPTLQNNFDLSNSHNTARSLFINNSLENEFKRLQNPISQDNNTSCFNRS
jgi:hypothetical protein